MIHLSRGRCPSTHITCVQWARSDADTVTFPSAQKSRQFGSAEDQAECELIIMVLYITYVYYLVLYVVSCLF